MKIVAVIPARMGSSRFPGKPLAPILGRPMIQWVYEGSLGCPRLSEVYIATCDVEIRDAARSFGAPVVMTSERHERASDRVAEVAEHLDADVVVMVQGDEPMVVPEMVTLATEPFATPGVLCTNLASVIESEEEFHDRNTIKVVFNQKGEALYFSREPVPTCTRGKFRSGVAYRQVCVIGFRRQFLVRYTTLEPTDYEKLESIDMLRILEHGYPVHIVRTSHRSHPVDTESDLKGVERLLVEAKTR